MYNVKIIEDKSKINECETALIDKYCWGGEYRPESSAKLGFISDKGLVARLFCAEKSPRAVYTEINSPVHKDSCLEFFADFFPSGEHYYFNFEANSNGVHHCEWGKKGGRRGNLSALGFPLPIVTPFTEENGWGLIIEIPLTLISAAYGRGDFGEGSEFTGNFYKCGDDTETPHYGSYGELHSDFPAFHLPEQFQSMRITR